MVDSGIANNRADEKDLRITELQNDLEDQVNKNIGLKLSLEKFTKESGEYNTNILVILPTKEVLEFTYDELRAQVDSGTLMNKVIHSISQHQIRIGVK